jgi:glycosyltransferase involved in cell wall biosynthesis
LTTRRITVVASELLGRPGTGGAATADSLLATALGRHGHRVELLIAPGREIGPLSPEWERIYEDAGVRVRFLEPRSATRPSYLAPPMEVFHALSADPPDLVVADDWRGLAYAAQRARQLGLGLSETAFVVLCHGPARVLAEFAQKVPDTLARFGEEVAERASIALADAVVSPSAWLLSWMGDHGWPVPASARVVQNLSHSAALGTSPARASAGSAVRRLAFFGQLREGKGVRIFLASLGALEPDLLRATEVVFLGRETPRWTAERIRSQLDSGAASRPASIRIETALDRAAALDQLRVPGTLAVMPSLLDNSPYTVAECIEHGIPFVAARTGGIPELVADADRERVLFEPTTHALTATLRHALTSSEGIAPARAAREAEESLDAWLELVESVAPAEHSRVAAATRVGVVATGEESARRARRLAEHTSSVEVEVVSAGSRNAGLARATADWVVFLDDDDVPDDRMLETLVAAQAASDADVVTAAVRPAQAPGYVQLFLGDPGSLGLIENHYGVLGLVRRALLDSSALPEGDVDPDWPLFAQLALAGARIVSIPEPLSSHKAGPGHVGDVPGDGLAVLRLFEEAKGARFPDLPQLAATLAAAIARLRTTSHSDESRSKHIVQRSLDVLRAEGFGSLARKVGGRVGRMRARRRRPKLRA